MDERLNKWDRKRFKSKWLDVKLDYKVNTVSFVRIKRLFSTHNV